jgi:two-component system, OmpR family, phosphate regulon sensor histidine kinase PhoR
MQIGARGKLFLVTLALLVVSLIAAEIYLLPAVEHDLTERIRQDLYVRLHLAAERASTYAQPEDAAIDWDVLADRLGSIAQARVTFILEDGRVVGDSEVPAQDLGTLENHRERPEVAAAFDGRTTDNIRYSATTRKRMLYAATRVPGNSKMVARVSLPLAWVDQAKSKTRTLLLGGALVAMLAAVVLSSAAAVILSRGLRGLTAVARRMAGGELDARSRLESADEIGELGRTLDHLAANLSRSVRELRDDRDLLGRILESMREGVLVMDGEHRILLANPSLREMLLLDSDVTGRSTIEVIRNAELQSIVEKAMAAKDPMLGEIEVGGIKPRRLLVHASRLSGEPRALVLVLFDVTEMRRLETVRRDFVANVSHELRTPVASVRSAAETLRMAIANDPKAATQFLDIIERNGRRLGELINDLLDLSRIEAKEYRLKVETSDLRQLCEKTVSVFAERASSRNMRLAVEIPNGFPPAAVDVSAFDRILTNLVDNALKYCPDGASVSVSAREAGTKLQVVVSDSGPGIDAKHLPRLFERFYRVDNGRSRDMGGTGLGLSIVKHLVEAMGGEVSVESLPGRGATFAFTLSRADS